MSPTKRAGCRRYAVTRADSAPEDRSTVLVDATYREMAKRLAVEELGGDPDMYLIQPLPALDPDTPRLVWKDNMEIRS